MYFLEKCENCDRSGSVALEFGDKVCNLCKNEEPKVWPASSGRAEPTPEEDKE